MHLGTNAVAYKIRTTLKPSDSTISCTAAPTSPSVAPARTVQSHFPATLVTSSNRCVSGDTFPTGIVIAESP